MVELADTRVLKTLAAKRMGSSPIIGIFDKIKR